MKKLQSEENEEDNFNQEEETYEDNDGDNYNPEVQEEETNEKNEISFDGHPEIELTHTQASRALPKISRMSDICMDRPKYATLVCGHRYCYQCALQMRLDERVCAISRRCIVSVIKTYNWKLMAACLWREQPPVLSASVFLIKATYANTVSEKKNHYFQ